MRMPQGYVNLSGKVVRLNESLYGLKQASRSWHAHLTTFSKQLGFQLCHTDACVFRLVEEGRVAITAVIHMDDIFAVGRKSRCGYFCEDLGRMAPVKYLGVLRWCGGCQFSRDQLNGLRKISQKTVADSLVKKSGVVDAKSIPLPVGIKLEEFNQDEPVGTWPLRESIGSLMWLPTQTRPDIANEVRAVARYCAGPIEIHSKTALGILAYIKGTSGHGIIFQRALMDGLLMQVFADAGYASKATDRRSVSGGLIMWGGVCVCWFSRSQKCVTMPTTEAEYIAMAETEKEVLFLQQVWCFMLPGAGTLCVPVFEDIEGAVQLA